MKVVAWEEIGSGFNPGSFQIFYLWEWEKLRTCQSKFALCCRKNNQRWIIWGNNKVKAHTEANKFLSGGCIAQRIAFALGTQRPRVWFSAFPRIFLSENLSHCITVIYWRHFLDQWTEAWSRQLNPSSTGWWKASTTKKFLSCKKLGRFQLNPSS